MNGNVKHFFAFSVIFCFLGLGISLGAVDTTLSFDDLGMGIKIQNNQVTVTSVQIGSVADSSGFQKGDSIVGMWDDPIYKVPLNEMIDGLTQKRGTTLVKISRKTSTGTVEKDILVSFLNKQSSPVVVNTGATRTAGNSVLSLTPSMVHLLPGKTCSLAVHLDNPSGKMADEIAFWIHYNPSSLTLMSNKDKSFFDINTVALSGWSKVTAYSIKSTGDLFVRLTTANKTKALAGDLGTIEFKTTARPFNSDVHFVFNDWGKLPNTLLTSKGKDVLGKENDPKDGVIGSTIKISQ